jgi:hypothetical protein
MQALKLWRLTDVLALCDGAPVLLEPKTVLTIAEVPHEADKFALECEAAAAEISVAPLAVGITPPAVDKATIAATSAQVAKVTDRRRLAIEKTEALKVHMRSDVLLLRAVQSVDDLISALGMKLMHEDALIAQSIDELEELKEKWKLAYGMASQLKEAASHSADSLKGAIENKERSAIRDVENKKKVELKTALDNTKKIAKEAANRVQRDLKQAPPLFKLGFHKLVEENIVMKVASLCDDAALTDVRVPSLRSGGSAVANWKVKDTVVLALSNFGASYKKEPALKTTGMVQLAMAKGGGKDETDGLFKELDALAANHAIVFKEGSPGIALNRGTWLYGYESMASATAVGPYGASFAKTLAVGEVSWVFFELASLSAALLALGVTSCKDVDSILKYVDCLEEATLKHLQESPRACTLLMQAHVCMCCIATCVSFFHNSLNLISTHFGMIQHAS